MGQTSSLPNEPSSSTAGGRNAGNSHEIRQLIEYARANYQHNPTESLAALMRALTLNSGAESAEITMQRLRDELGDDIAELIGSHHARMERALLIVQELLADESTLLYEQGREDLLRQTMEDGSSVVCSKCSAVVSSQRWQQHQLYWCEALPSSEEEEGKDQENSPME